MTSLRFSLVCGYMDKGLRCTSLEPRSKYEIVVDSFDYKDGLHPASCISIYRESGQALRRDPRYREWLCCFKNEDLSSAEKLSDGRWRFFYKTKRSAWLIFEESIECITASPSSFAEANVIEIVVRRRLRGTTLSWLHLVAMGFAS